MKISEYLSQRRPGDLITNKQFLSVLKRKGLIYGYSQWGYLESCQVRYLDNWKGSECLEYGWYEVFPNGTAKKCTDTTFPNLTAAYDCMGRGNVSYGGYTFTCHYVSGCFQPFLAVLSVPEC